VAERSQQILQAAPAKEFDIVHEDEWLLVINKPSGVAVHGGSGVNFGVIEQLRQARPEARYLELVHRLDKDTSGLLMIAKKRSCLVKLHELLRDHHPYKSYIALGVGAWPDKVRHVKLPLFKYTGAQGEKMVRVAEEGQFAHTVFEVLKPFTLPNALQAATLVRAVLKTGRTHQIRVHMQAQHCPIAGDERYGDYEVNKKLAKAGLKRMFLHAHQLKFTHPMTNEPVQFTAPLPKALSQFLESISDEKTVSSLNL
jgi:23S rRNA pseudouridine955/2504/2580 synthase